MCKITYQNIKSVLFRIRILFGQKGQIYSEKKGVFQLFDEETKTITKYS
jgi:hypothetical protein